MRVLVVEDEPDVRELARTTLSLSGYEVLTAPDAGTGLDLAAKRQPDVIVLDIMLPGTDGIALLEELKRREDTWRIPVILLTALVRPEIEIQGMVAGADSYIRKPFSPPALNDEIERLASAGPSVREARREKAIQKLLTIYGTGSIKPVGPLF